MIGKKRFHELQSTRRRGLSRLLLMARRNFLERVTQAIEASGLPAMPDACIMLLAYIDLEGTRSTVIAQRAHTTRQAVAQVIAVLEQMGLVRKYRDADDARASIVCFTERGADYLVHLHAVIDETEREFARRIGEREMEITRRTLERLAYGDEVAGDEVAGDEAAAEKTASAKAAGAKAASAEAAGARMATKRPPRARAQARTRARPRG
ncbi:MAG: MarR family winged helix-turn-helix transcriptional regulator [Burkholderiaceae bacterium]